MDLAGFVHLFKNFLDSANQESWIEVIEIKVTAQQGEFTTRYEHQYDFDKIVGVCSNYLPDYANEKAGEITEFKVGNESVFFSKGTSLDLITARNHQNVKERFFPVCRKIRRSDFLQISIKDTSQGDFTPYIRKIYVLMRQSLRLDRQKDTMDGN